MKKGSRRDKFTEPPRHVIAGSPFDLMLLVQCGLLGLLVLMVFGQVAGHSFVDWDDQPFIVHFPAYNPPTLKSLGDIWTWRADSTTFFVPVLYSIWWVTAVIARRPEAAGETGVLSLQSDPFSAAPFHLLNLLAHLVAAITTLLILRRLLTSVATQRGGSWPAFFGAAVFAFHPIQAEAVSWASTFYTSASAALGLLAMLCHIRAMDAERPAARWAWYAGATALFLTSLLTKPSMVALPLLIPIADLWLLKRPRTQWLVSAVLMVPWLVAGLSMGLLTSQFRQDASLLFHPSWPQRLLIAGDALSFYLRQIVLPFGFAPDYGRTPQRVLANSSAAAIWAAIPVVLTLLALLLRKRCPWLIVGWAAFVAGMAATLGLVPFEYQLYSTTADRYAYFSMLGVGLAVAGFLGVLLGGGSPGTAAKPPRLQPTPVFAASGTLVLILAILGGLQAGRWHDTVTLFNHTLAVNPDSSAAHRALLVHYARDRKYDQALPHGDKAIAGNPADARLWWFQGLSLMESAANLPADQRNTRLMQAADHLRQAAKLTRDRHDEVQAGLGITLAQAGQFAEAESVLLEARRMNPKNVDVRRNLAVLYRRSGRLDQAATEAEAAATLQPNDPNFAAMARQFRLEAQRAATTRPK